MQQRPTLSAQLISGNSVPELVSCTGPEWRVRGPVRFLGSCLCRREAGLEEAVSQEQGHRAPGRLPSRDLKSRAVSHRSGSACTTLSFSGARRRIHTLPLSPKGALSLL